jgi:hypothetical protein
MIHTIAGGRFSSKKDVHMGEYYGTPVFGAKNESFCSILLVDFLQIRSRNRGKKERNLQIKLKIKIFPGAGPEKKCRLFFCVFFES